MAVCWQIYKLNCYLRVALWVILVSLHGTQSSEPSYNIQGSARSKQQSLAYTRFEREVDDTSFPPQSAENEEENVSSALNPGDIPAADYNDNVDSIISPENVGDSQMEEEDEIKPKLTNKQQKYIPNYFKNYSKVIVNDSLNEKQKPGMYGPQGFKNNNLSKKETKFNTNSSEMKVNATNLAVPNSYMLENSRVRSDPLPIASNVSDTDKSVPISRTKPSEPLMSDQPQLQPADNITNTDSAEDDSEFTASQNTTGSFEENNGTTSADGRTMPPSEGLDFLFISGIVLGTAVFLGLVAGGGYAVYRHRIWNKPQTLSDKCSNADSSGYIDDSTLRENSEEMYSLDNDSFLNSLEAMTIQNYWTDNVKHTKL